MEGEKKIEKYQFSLRRQLGQGSYATVYLGRVIETGQPVAVKVIDKKIFSNAYNVKNIQSEIDIMKKVSHQNIVQLFDIYQTTNNMYIVTELCQDGDLLRLLHKKKRVPERQAKDYLRDIMNGAKYLHKSGIIHRDLKPANILLQQATCKLSDFGFAKSLKSQEAVMKSIVGTPLYMSPQILKKGKYTAKSDLWSIGLIYYQMLHGRTPWPAQNELQLINGIYHKKVAFCPEISQHSKDFIRRCLEISQEDRISWEDAFNHQLLTDSPLERSFPLEFKKHPKLVLEDKENNGSFSNKMKTPNNKYSKKDKKSPLALKTPKNLSNCKAKKEEECLTPKGGHTPKAKSQLSNIKQKIEIMPRRDKDSTDNSSTVKKQSRLPSKNDILNQY